MICGGKGKEYALLLVLSLDGPAHRVKSALRKRSHGQMRKALRLGMLVARNDLLPPSRVPIPWLKRAECTGMTVDHLPCPSLPVEEFPRWRA
jgi:hypothetical protein